LRAHPKTFWKTIVRVENPGGYRGEATLSMRMRRGLFGRRVEFLYVGTFSRNEFRLKERRLRRAVRRAIKEAA
jgi:hypothetical protein